MLASTLLLVAAAAFHAPIAPQSYARTAIMTAAHETEDTHMDRVRQALGPDVAKQERSHSLTLLPFLLPSWLIDHLPSRV